MNINKSLLFAKIGKKIKAERNSLGLTQMDLSKSTGLLRTSIANIESGRQHAPLHILYNISAELKIEIESLLPSIDEVPINSEIDIKLLNSSKVQIQSMHKAVEFIQEQNASKNKK